MSKKLEEIFTDLTNISNQTKISGSKSKISGSKSKKLKSKINYRLYKSIGLLILFGLLFLSNYEISLQTFKLFFQTQNFNFKNISSVLINLFTNSISIQNLIILFLIYLFL